MFARFVTTHVEPEKFSEATNVLENKIIPRLRKQPGFQDEVTFFDKNKKEAVAISFWDTRQDAENYERELYPEVRDTMKAIYREAPQVQSFEVANSTWYNIHAAA